MITEETEDKEIEAAAVPAEETPVVPKEESGASKVEIEPLFEEQVDFAR